MSGKVAGGGPWRLAPWLSLVAGAAVFGWTLFAPFYHDDRVQRAMALGTFPAPRGVFDLYDFVRASERSRFVELGVLPWWTADEFTIRFFRPLASALLFVEHRWLGSATAMHAVSFGWWGAAVLSAAWLFRRALSPRAAAIATMVFALAPCHEPALALLAQREVLVTLTFGVLGLGVLGRTDEPLGARRAVLAAGLFALSLAAGEYGLCLGGYVFAQALALRDAAPRERVWRVAPFATVAVAYLATRAALGYSATGSAFYRDPIRAPGLFLAHAPHSASAILGDAWSTFDTEKLPVWLLLVLVASLVAVLVRVTPPGALRWLIVGSFLSLLPLLASAPSHRLVAPVLLGVAPALGALIDRALTAPRVWTVGGALVAAALHLVHAPMSSWSLARGSLLYAREQSRRAGDLEARTAGGPANVVALASLETAFFTGVSEREHDRGARRTHVLVTARHALLLRVDERTIDVVVPKGNGFLPVGADSTFRGENDPLPTGAEREVPGVHILVVSNGEVAAPRIRFTFDGELEASSGWLTETRAGFEPLALPRIGYGVQLSP